MGMAASQARLLTLTARLADNELRSQTINNAKMRLATQSSQASDEYVSALNKAQLQFANTDLTGASQNQLLTFNALSAYSPYNTQYGLVNSAGLLLVSEADAANFKAAGGNLEKFLQAYGIGWNTTYFGDVTDDSIAKSLVDVYGSGKTDDFYAKYMATLTNGDLKNYYERYDANSYSLEMSTYNKYAKAYAEEVATLNDKYMDHWFGNFFGRDSQGKALEISEIVKSLSKQQISSDLYKNPNRKSSLPQILRENIACTDSGKYTLETILKQFGTATNIGGTNYYGYNRNYSDLSSYNILSTGSAKGETVEVSTKVGEKDVIDVQEGENIKTYDAQTRQIPTYSYQGPDGSVSVNEGDAGLQKNDDGSYVYNVTNQDGTTTQYPVTVGSYTQHYYVDGNNNEQIIADPSQIHKADVMENQKHQSYKPVLNFNVGNLNISFDLTGADNDETLQKYFSSESNYMFHLAEDGKLYGIEYDEEGNAYYTDNEGKKQNIDADKVKNNIGYYPVTNADGNYEYYEVGQNADGTYYYIVPEYDAEGNMTGSAHTVSLADKKDGLEQLFTNNYNTYYMNAEQRFNLLGYMLEARKEDGTPKFDINFDYAGEGTLVGAENVTSLEMLNNLYIDNNGSYTGFRFTNSNNGYTLAEVSLEKETEELRAKFLTEFLNIFKSEEYFSIEKFSQYMTPDEQLDLFNARENFIDLIFTEYAQATENGISIDLSGLAAGEYMDADKLLSLKLKLPINEDYQKKLHIQDDNGYISVADIINNKLKTANGDDIINSSFISILEAKITQMMIEELGEPNYTWNDSTDTAGTGNADVKAQWYTNLFNRMLKGYKTLENGLAASNEWLTYALESGSLTMEQVDGSYNWKSLDYKSCSSITEDTANTAELAKAEAKYKRAMNDIEAKDSVYDIQLKNLDTEHTTIQTEYDVVKNVISKNIERTMKFDQSA